MGWQNIVLDLRLILLYHMAMGVAIILRTIYINDPLLTRIFANHPLSFKDWGAELQLGHTKVVNYIDNNTFRYWAVRYHF